EQNCTSNSMTVKWHDNSTAQNYTVKAASASGVNSTCESTNSSCSFLDLSCGQLYSFTVMGYSNVCTSDVSPPIKSYTGKEFDFSKHNFCVESEFYYKPCAPVNLTVLYNVSTAQVMWAGAKDGGSFSVAAVNNKVQTVTCNSTNTHCSLVGLECSQIYNITVMVADPSSSLKCEPLSATVSWQQTGFALGYVAYVDSKGGHQTSCVSSNTTSCSISGLMCGTVYSVWVKALGKQHNSSDSSVISLTSGPCQPVIASVQAPCQSDEVQISWNNTDGAVNYLVRTAGNRGYMKTHNTTQSFLSATLPCGQEFNVTVQGQGSVCDSTPSSPAFFKTGNYSFPILITYGSLDSIDMPSDGAETYIAIATGVDSHTHQCLTNTTSCTWTDLHCGEEYTVVVRAKTVNCSSLIPSTPVEFSPCPPSNVSAQMTCQSSNMTVYWDAIRDADHFLVSLTSVNGTIQLCNTTTTTCFISNATCGETFTIQVTSVRASRQVSTCFLFKFFSSPCQPKGVNGHIDCVSNSAWITWDAALGANNYTVSAVGSGISTTNCTSITDTRCEVKDLACGVSFNFTVTASNTRCDSQPSAPFSLETGIYDPKFPCPPQNVSVNASCQTHSAVISWNQSPVAESYQVVATGANGHKHMCNTSSTSCSLTELHCDEQYTVSMTASHENCTSKPSQNATLNTGMY
uniref:Fibronectin type-III domain-containing protein n=1 Tax=Oryzias melastigma TaxID=30732 RepID=A0A3B3DY87_ORYME